MCSSVTQLEIGTFCLHSKLCMRQNQVYIVDISSMFTNRPVMNRLQSKKQRQQMLILKK